jgi:hypothetical protein
MLRFSEEIMLLLLDDESGEFAHIPEWSLRYALAGAVLMDLALENRIDTDPKRLTLLDPTPVGDDLLDPTLESISKSTEVHDICHWIEHVAENAYSIRDKSMKRLILSGILESRDDRFMWVFRSRRYPIVDGKAEREVKLRIMEVLFSDVIPDPRDIVIICLADACGIFRSLLSKQELKLASTRIEQVRKLDLIGQAVSQVVWNIEASLALSMHPMA